MTTKLFRKMLSMIVTIAMVLTMIPFGSIPFASAITGELANFTDNTNLKVYAYQTDDPTNKFISSYTGNPEYVTTASVSSAGTTGIWSTATNTLGKVADKGIDTSTGAYSYFKPNYTNAADSNMKQRAITVVLDLGAWYDVSVIKASFMGAGGANYAYRLQQHPAKVYVSSASTIEEVRDYGFKSYYGSTKDCSVVAQNTDTANTMTHLSAITGTTTWRANITKSAIKVRFVAIECNFSTQLDVGTYLQPLLSDISVTGNNETTSLNYSSVTSVSVANMPSSFNVGDNVYKALDASGAVVKDQSNNTLTPVYKFEGLNTSTTGTRLGVAWVGTETSSVDVPAARKTTFSYTVNSALNNVSLNQTYSAGALEPQMSIFKTSTDTNAYKLDTALTATTVGSSVDGAASNAYCNGTNFSGTYGYYPVTPQALSEHLVNPNGAQGSGNYNMQKNVQSTQSGTAIEGTASMNVGYFVIDLQKDYAIKMVQFTAMSNIIKPKLLYLSQSAGSSLVTGGQAKIGTATSPTTASPYYASETLSSTALGNATTAATADNASLGIPDATDYGNYNSKDTIVAFKASAGYTPSDSGQRASNLAANQVNATGTAEVTNAAVAATARYIIIQNQSTTAATTRIAEIKVWADTPQMKKGLKGNLGNLLTRYNAAGYGSTTEYTAAQTVYNDSAATQEQVDTAAYNLFNLTQTFNITWNVDGGSPAPTQTTVTYGSSISQPAAMTKTGYTFGGWYSDAGLTNSVTFPVTNVTSAQTYYAKWTINSYSITWNVDGGSPAPTQVSVNHGSSISQPAAMTRTGYTFGGWYSDVGLTTSVTFPVNNVTSAKTYYAKWTINSYSITWNVDGGSPAPTQVSVNHGSSISQPAAMTKTGYTFGGWYSDVGLTTSVTFPVNNVTSAKTYYAKWTINTYSITWNVDGGSPAPTQTTVDHGNSISQPAAMTKTGYTFGGWYSDVGLTTSVTFPVTNVTSAKTYYAKWTIITYSITWNVDGGSPAPTQVSVDHGSSISQPATMTKTGYTFGGWYSDVGLTTSVTFPVNNVTSAQTYYAKWTINSYSITWNVNGGSPAPTQTTVTHGSSIAAPATMTRTGYNFGGWYSDAGYTQSVTFPVTNVTSAKTYYAKWTIKTYSITWNVNGGSPAPTQTTVNHGSSISQPATMTKTGYTFSGWYSDAGFTTSVTFPVTNVTSAKTYYAKWTYAITFVTDTNTSISVLQVLPGGTITPPTAPTKVGYTFTAYKTVIGGAFNSTATGNIKYVANYTKNASDTYLVSVVDGTATGAGTGTLSGSTTNYAVLYDTLITLTAPTANGTLVFAYWTVNGKIVSYENTFSTRVPGAITYQAVYELDAPSPTPKVVVAAVTEVATNMDKVVIQYKLPTGMYIYNAGLVVSKTSNATLETANILDAQANGVTSTSQYATTVSFETIQTVSQVYVRGYLVYGDSNGNRYTIYTDEVVLSKAVVS